jgi:hypothetical protein
MIAGKVSFQDFFIALLAVMFAAFGVGQGNSDFGARQRGLVAAARIFSLVSVYCHSLSEFLENRSAATPHTSFSSWTSH